MYNECVSIAMAMYNYCVVVVHLLLCSELCGLSEVDPAADWWSLGAILFEILTGKVHIHLLLHVFASYTSSVWWKNFWGFNFCG